MDGRGEDGDRDMMEVVGVLGKGNIEKRVVV